MQTPTFRGSKPRKYGRGGVAGTTGSGRGSSSSNWRQKPDSNNTDTSTRNGNVNNYNNGFRKSGSWKPKPKCVPDRPTRSAPPPRPASQAVLRQATYTYLPFEEEAQSKAQRDREAMRRYLERNVDLPRYNPVDWDVKVVCGPFVWYLHWKIIRKCQYFTALLPPPGETDWTECEITLHQHDPGQLANVLRFMYFKEYPGAVFDHLEPLYGDSLVTNTAMYVAAASVGHKGMMGFAKKHLQAWSEVVLTPSCVAYAADNVAGCRESPLQKAIREHPRMDYALLRLADCLRRSLAIVYEQPQPMRTGPLFGLRLVLVRFIGAALPYLAVNAAFQSQFRNEWDRPSSTTDKNGVRDKSLIDNITLDHAMFTDLRMIGYLKEADSSSSGGTATTTTKRTSPPSLARTFTLLQRLAKNERLWVSTGSVAVAGSGSGKSNSDDKSLNTGSEMDGRCRRNFALETSMCDHRKALEELTYGLECILAG